MKGLEKDSKRTPNWLSLAGMSCDIANLSYITRQRDIDRDRQTKGEQESKHGRVSIRDSMRESLCVCRQVD